MRKTKNMNRSTRRTRAAIQKAMLAAMDEKPISSITVQEIINTANVCRTTFYAHYEDINDLVKSIGDEIIDQVGANIQSISISSDNLNELPVFTSILNAYYEHADTIRLLISENGDPTFNERMQERIYQAISDLRRQYDDEIVDEKRLLYYSYYVIGGGISVLNKLIRSHQEWNPEMAKYFLNDMASYGQSVIMKKIV